MWKFYLPVFLSVAGCATQNSVAPTNSAVSKVVGCYSSSDVVGYNNAKLHLNSSGAYKAETFGEFGSWGSVEGVWNVDNSGTILFSPSRKPKEKMIVNPNKLYQISEAGVINLWYRPTYRVQDEESYGWGIFRRAGCEL